MDEMTMIGWVVVSLITLFILNSWANKPFKEQDKKFDEEISAVKTKMYQLHDDIKKEVIQSNKDLTASINELTSTMRLFKQTFDNWKEVWEKQDEFNEELEMEVDQLKSDFKDFKHQCEKVHYYKVREP